jgi:site-specific DNA-cytosine methylase
MISSYFESYPPDITQHVIDAMTPHIESEIKRVHEAVEKAKAVALAEALAPLAANDDPHIEQPPPEPPAPSPSKRRTSWDGMSAEQRSAVVKGRWATRKANAAQAGQKQKPTAKKGSLNKPSLSHSVRYASVCSGVEGLSLAWEPLGGFTPVFFSEIEAFPSAVLAKRWPEVPNLGDLTKIEGREWKGKIDVLWASLPCQSFSLTGNRYGAKDKRGAMFRPFRKLADEIDPPVIIMENVVGLRSDPVFREILEGLSGSDFAGRIAKSGTHDGPSRRLAWKVLDSGTEQRRLRLFLVACSLASGIDPSAILPQPEGFAPDRRKAQMSAGAAPESTVIWLNADTTPKWSETRVGTLRAAGGSGGRSLVCVDGRVRGLMPEERERLMGWEGDHTAIEWKGTERTLDRLRNRAIGNSLALPPVRAIGEKLKAALGSAKSANDNGQPWSMVLGDCLTEMATLLSASFDLIVADPPYGATACAWDRPLDLDLFWTEVRRVLKPNGTVVLTSAGRFTADLISSNPSWFKYSLVWEKTRKSQFLHAKYRPLVAHEDILVFSPAGACERARVKMTYNPQGVTDLVEPKIKDAVPGASSIYKPITSRASTRIQTQTNYPSSILTFASEGKNLHPTQKPVALMEYLIATYSNPCDTVLDPTMGSGTTGVAARKLGRGFIGIEMDKKFFEIAVSRLADESRMAA